MRRRQLAVLAAVLVIGIPFRAEAEPSSEHATYRADIGFFVGGHFIPSDSELGNSSFEDQVPESGPLLGARGGYVLIDGLKPTSTLDLGLGIELEAKITVSSTAGNLPMGRSAYHAQVLGWRAHARIDLRRDAKTTPFALLGVGGETVFSSSPHLSSVDTDFAFHWGLGATYEIVPRYGVRVDLRHAVTASRERAATATFEVHMGFVYAFESFARAEPRVGKLRL